MNEATYALLIDYAGKGDEIIENLQFVEQFLRAYGWQRLYVGSAMYVPNADYSGMEGLLKIAGRIPASIMNKIRSINVLRITDINDVTDTIGVNLVTKG